MEAKYVLSFPTRFGLIHLYWEASEDGPRVLRITLPIRHPGRLPLSSEDLSIAQPLHCPEMDQLVDRIVSFCDGSPIRFSLDLVRMDLCGAFQQRVLIAEHAIPRGEVRSYGQLARELGDPKAARAVGTALARNPFPIIIPCHRAIRSDGTLGGYQGGLDMKRALLEMEGLQFDPQGRVIAY